MNRLIVGVLVVIGIFGAVASGMTLMGCETMKGAGRDIEDTGHNIQKTAE